MASGLKRILASHFLESLEQPVSKLKDLRNGGFPFSFPGPVRLDFPNQKTKQTPTKNRFSRNKAPDPDSDHSQGACKNRNRTCLSGSASKLGHEAQRAITPALGAVVLVTCRQSLASEKLTQRDTRTRTHTCYMKALKHEGRQRTRIIVNNCRTMYVMIMMVKTALWCC